MNHVDTGHDLKQLAGDMLRGSVAGRRHVDLARIGLGVGNELGNGLGWNRWIHQHYEWLANDARDWRDVADEIETELVVKCRVDRVHRSYQEERVAVRSRTHDRLGTDVGAGARPVLDDEWLAEPPRQPLADQASDDVGSTAWRKRHNPAHRPCRITLRPNDPRCYRKRGNARC